MISVRPQLPGRTVFPGFIERDKVTVCVHTVPVTRVVITHQLAVARHALQRITFKDALIVVCQVVKDLLLENEEAAADEAFVGLRLFTESFHSVAVDRQFTIARQWPHASYRR